MTVGRKISPRQYKEETLKLKKEHHIILIIPWALTPKTTCIKTCFPRCVFTYKPRCAQKHTTFHPTDHQSSWTSVQLCVIRLETTEIKLTEKASSVHPFWHTLWDDSPYYRRKHFMCMRLMVTENREEQWHAVLCNGRLCENAESNGFLNWIALRKQMGISTSLEHTCHWCNSTCNSFI